MPDGSKGGGPRKVLYQCAEDDIADTIKPRLMTADADCSMVAFIQDDDRPLRKISIWRPSEKTECGYPFYSAGYALQSAGFNRHKHINEPLGDQRRILMARRVHPRLGQTLAAQRLELS